MLDSGKEWLKRALSRCEAYGLDPDQLYSRRIIQGAELEQRYQSNQSLMAVAAPFICQLCDFLRGSSFFAILTDHEGCILQVTGDEEILTDALALKMIPGAFMDEANIGTNAMGTALAENSPIQISGEEHFITAYHRWTCSGAPIHDAQGVIIGSIDLTGYNHLVHQHTLGMVVAAANAIEKNLELEASNQWLRHSNLFSAKLMDSIQTGIISCRLDGGILTVNTQVRELFGFDSQELLNSTVADFLPAWPEIRQAVIRGDEFQNRDLQINCRKNKLYFNVCAYPVKDGDTAISSVILIIKDLKRVRKHANEITGRRAVYTFDKMIGASPAFIQALEFGKQVADSNSTVLITGESGTGKEIFAQSIHNYGSRRDEPFVVLNCGAIPRTLIESELFGYIDGAFTGAKRGGQAGKFEIADGGTIFLDEIGEMPLDMQVTLLRVLEEGTVVRLGSSNYLPVDVRVIAATNKDLRAEVAKGRFRMDLYYRLNVLPLRLPALRERPSDIPLLAEYYLDKIARKTNRRPVAIGPADLDLMCAYDWPGNIRELENVIELIINTGQLPAQFVGRASEASATVGTLSEDGSSLQDAEARFIFKVLSENGYNIAAAARRMKIGRNTLYRKMKTYGLQCSTMEHCSNIAHP